jgi:biotin carboxylase
MTALALELGVVGLMNAQFAVKDKTVYVLEVNPRGSRTVPFVSKAIGVPLAKLAMKTMIGRSLDDLGFVTAPKPVHLSVKEAVFPFNKFPARRRAARPGDEVDRRGHGDRRGFRVGLRQIAGRCRRDASDERNGVYQRQRN